MQCNKSKDNYIYEVYIYIYMSGTLPSVRGSVRGTQTMSTLTLLFLQTKGRLEILSKNGPSNYGEEILPSFTEKNDLIILVNAR